MVWYGTDSANRSDPASAVPASSKRYQLHQGVADIARISALIQLAVVRTSTRPRK